MKGEIIMTKKNFLKITTYAAVFGIIGGMSFEGVTYLSDKLVNKISIEDTVKPEQDLEENQTGNSSYNCFKLQWCIRCSRRCTPFTGCNRCYCNPD